MSSLSSGMTCPTLRLLALFMFVAEGSRVQLPYHAQSAVKELGKCQASINASDLVRTQLDKFPVPAVESAPVAHSADLAMINQYIYGGAKEFNKVQDYRVLVTGCGSASWFAMAQHLASYTTKAEIVCQDISTKMLARVRQKVDASDKFAGVKFVYTQRSLEGSGHFEELGKFDFIHCVGVLQHLTD